jgi:inner membrane protein
MENVTHTLLGAALAQTGLKRLSPLASTTLLVSSNIPDIDIASLAFGRFVYFEWHRGITHSLFGFPVMAILLGAAIHSISKVLWHRGKIEAPGKFLPLTLLSLIGTATHPLLDFTNAYGWRPFLPWKSDWYYIDLTFVLDPWIWLGLGGALFLSTAVTDRQVGYWLAGGIIAGAVIVLSHVSLTIKIIWVLSALVLLVMRLKWGSVDERSGRLLNLAAIGAMLAYIAALAALQGVALFRAAEVAQVAVAANEQIVEVNALPTEANPFKWRAVIVTENAFHTCDVGVTDRGESHPQLTRYPRLTGDQAAFEAALSSKDVRTFLRFARFPVATIVDKGDGKREVEIEDIRFGGVSNAFRIRVKLDRDRKPVEVH